MWHWLAQLLDATRPWWPFFLGVALWLFLVLAMEIV
jgi:hypothetical protein